MRHKAIKAKSVLVLLLFALANKAVSQTSFELRQVSGNALVSQGAVIDLTCAAQASHNELFDIKNTSSSAHSYKVKRYNVLLNATGNSTASAFFSFAGTNFPPLVFTSPLSLSLAPGQSASSFTLTGLLLETGLQEANSKGLSIIKYTVFNSSQPGDSLQFTIRYNPVFASLTLYGEDNSYINVYPNPAKTTLNVQGLTITDYDKLYVFNASGSICVEMSLHPVEGKDIIELILPDLPKGIYFLRLISYSIAPIIKPFAIN